MTVDTQKELWDKVANTISFSIEPDIDEIHRHITSDSIILDYGCGYGRVSKLLYDAGHKNIIGVDTSNEMILRGKKQFPELNLQHISNYKGNMQHGIFDLIVLCAVFTCLPKLCDRQLITNLIYNLLKPDGLLYFAEFARDRNRDYEPDGTFLSSFGVKMKHFNLQELEEELNEFEGISSYTKTVESLSGNKTTGIHFIGRKKNG